MPRHPCILMGPQKRGTKSEFATSPLPCRGPKRGQKCDAAPAFSGIGNAKRGHKIQKWPPHPCLLRGPKEGGNATSPLHSRGSREERTKSEVVASPLLSYGPTEGVNATRPCILGDPQRQARGGKAQVVPNKGEQNHNWLPQPWVLGGPKEGGDATSGLHSPPKGGQAWPMSGQ